MGKTQILDDGADGIAKAAALLQAGGLVAFPTETVYGLGADAGNGAAVARIFAAKGRPRFNPLIVHVPDLAAADRLVDLSGVLGDLAAAFWPGPLTLVAPARAGNGVAGLVSAGLSTLAVRVPGHPLAQQLLTSVGRPIAAPSANASGRISPTKADHVLGTLDGRIDAVLDGGACAVGLESTIVGLADGAPVLLRAGGITGAALAAVVGDLPVVATGSAINAPGQLASHYAPVSGLRLNATERRAGDLFLGFGAVDGDLNLSRSGDLLEAAAALFDALHRLDDMVARGKGRAIAVAPIPEVGLGVAINDRLRRAAAPRGQEPGATVG